MTIDLISLRKLRRVGKAKSRLPKKFSKKRGRLTKTHPHHHGTNCITTTKPGVKLSRCERGNEPFLLLPDEMATESFFLDTTKLRTERKKGRETLEQNTFWR